MKLFLSFLLSFSLYCQSNIAELIDIREIIPDIKLDIRYQTDYNFANQKLYVSNVCYLALGAAQQLKIVQDSLRKLGYSLKIYDGYRPRAIQWLLWEIYPDPNFVADPRTGSRHNRGSAVDLTIVYLSSGKELDMGTAFDYFGKEAGHNYKEFSEEILKNRELLKYMMVAIGKFDLYEYEWWHYNYKEGKNFPLKEYQAKN